ncbi:uncharacterized protein K452DRAFT_292714 [Aplosporella prunicola CBS 121167]|uniref:Aromatic prenyltransferase n=1 Tax=Aplosporella prunicola CBS 121167 TaxID=1176127 RepID=A0A6A6B033_9PEZI|nr:uncharacterized protein K452DRAFT_292714 [Aplosporella prunicola CBS 121167]KAF2136061.1 hypothetical protein K452DRAFT_292714 [Aplosporella prunicola CBS 121167]
MSSADKVQPEVKSSDQLLVWNAISRFLPVSHPDHSYWWKVTGRHLALMMHEAEYPLERQIENLLFYFFTVIPRLGPQPTSREPWFKSRVAAGAGDGAPIGYSWRWSIGDTKPGIRYYIEPVGALTGTPADQLNEVATKELLVELGSLLPDADLSLFWKFAPHLRPNLTDSASLQAFAGSALLLGVEIPPSSSAVDIMTYWFARAPTQAAQLLDSTLPAAMRDAYGAEADLTALAAVRDFMAKDPNGSQLTMTGTTATDCRRPADARVKIYVATRNSSFDHIAAVMTFGGRKTVSSELMAQLQELWYRLKGLQPDFPTSAQLPLPAGDGGANPIGLSFYFDIQPKHALPDVKAYFAVGKHAKTDLAAAEAVTGFLERHGRGRYTKAYMNALQGVVTPEELRTRRGAQAYYSVAFKKGQVDITSYFVPQVYRRFDEIEAEINGR